MPGASIAVSEGGDEGDTGALGGIGDCVVPIGLKIGAGEKIALSGGNAGHDGLGGILRIVECPLERDGIDELLGTQCVEASAPDWSVFDARYLPLKNCIRMIERGDPVGAVLDDGGGHGGGGDCIGAGLEAGVRKHPDVDGFHLLHGRGLGLAEAIARAGC